MQCIYSANYFDDRQGLRYYVRDLDIDSATALRDDIHHAGKELIQDKAYEQGIELLMIAAHCGDTARSRKADGDSPHQRRNALRKFDTSP